eukprot:735528-Amphidinium_carterae.1
MKSLPLFPTLWGRAVEQKRDGGCYRTCCGAAGATYEACRRPTKAHWPFRIDRCSMVGTPRLGAVSDWARSSSGTICGGPRSTTHRVGLRPARWSWKF